MSLGFIGLMFVNTMLLFQIMARAQNVYAHVNAGFLFRLDPYNNIIEKPNIVYGGINSKFVSMKCFVVVVGEMPVK